MELSKYIKPKSHRQLEVYSKTKNLKNKPEAKKQSEPLKDPLLDPFGVPPMGWMPSDKLMSIMASRDAELSAKTEQD